MSIYFGVLLLILCTFAGFRLSAKYSERRKFFTDLFTFNEKIINEVSFSQNSLLSIVENEKKLNSDFGKTICEIINGEEVKSVKYLKNEEIEVLIEYINKIGKSDRESQILYLSSEKKIIDEIRVAAINDEKKYGKLYVKLGFLFGLIIFVIFI